MARRKKSLKREGEMRTSFMFPWLHKDVAKEVADTIPTVWYCKSSREKQAENEYTTHVMGKFECTNSVCSKPGWDSKMVAILIRGYAEHGYNAVVYNQRCEACNQLGTLNLNKRSYVERVAYRVQKWADVPLESQHYEKKKGLPHKEEFCEGCKRGICRQMNV